MTAHLKFDNLLLKGPLIEYQSNSLHKTELKGNYNEVMQ